MYNNAALPLYLLDTLTPQEWKALLHMADDLRNPQIAETMFITVKSVEEYHTRIGRKLDLQGPGCLQQFARRNRQLLKEHFDKLYPPPFLSK